MTRSTLLTLTLLPFVLLGCEPTDDATEPAVDAPRLADLSMQSQTNLVDRDATLAAAVDFDAAEDGEVIDLAANSGFRMDMDGSAITSHNEGLPRMYTNYTAAVVGVVAADLTTVSVVAAPALAIGIAADGEITQLAPNVWQAVNTVPIAGQDVTAELTVAWVGIGWVSEMRYSNATVQDKLWFNGFLAHGNGVGWWDLYDDSDTHAGVVEWISNGTDGEFGIVALAGEHAGDSLIYTSLAGHHRIDHHDASTGADQFIDLQPDLSGSVKLTNYAGAAVSCWDTDFLDTACAL